MHKAPNQDLKPISCRALLSDPRLFGGASGMQLGRDMQSGPELQAPRLNCCKLKGRDPNNCKWLTCRMYGMWSFIGFGAWRMAPWWMEGGPKWNLAWTQQLVLLLDLLLIAYSFWVFLVLCLNPCSVAAESTSSPSLAGRVWTVLWKHTVIMPLMGAVWIQCERWAPFRSLVRSHGTATFVCKILQVNKRCFPQRLTESLKQR